MKCKYTFKVNGSLKTGELRPVTIRGWTYEFSIKDGVINEFSVIVPANNPGDLPTIIQTPESRSKMTIHLTSPLFSFVKREVRAIEGSLALFGIESINVNSSKIEWLPENEEDKNRLQLFNFKSERGQIDISKLPNIPFDLIARAIICANEITEIESQLAFCRKGIVERTEERYIEAIYDFYFFLESLFAQGKTKNHRVKESFKSSKELKECIEEVFKEPSYISLRRKDIERFMEKYGQMSIDDIIDHIVDLRGFLHHHTPNRKDAWHPEEHKRYEIECNLFGAIAFCVAMRHVLKYIYRQDVIDTYNKMFVHQPPQG
jgi:hypothetical protein